MRRNPGKAPGHIGTLVMRHLQNQAISRSIKDQDCRNSISAIKKSSFTSISMERSLGMVYA